MKSAQFRPFIIFSVIAIAVNISGCDNAEQRQHKYLERAKEHFAAANDDKARIEVKNVLQINPKNAEARLLLARIYRNSGDYRQAFGIFNSIVEDEPNNVAARLELAKIYFAGNQDERALEYVDVILKQDAKNKDALLIMAGIESRKQNFDKAIEIANAILKDYPADPGAIAVITSAKVSDDPKGALAILAVGLSQHQNNLLLKTLKLQVLNQLKDDAAIEALLKEIISENPTRLEFYFQLARGYAIQKKMSESEAVLTQAVANNSESMEAKIQLIQFISAEHGLEKAESTARQFVAGQPQNFDLKKLLAQFYLENKKVDEAKSVFQQVIVDQPQGADAMTARFYLAQVALAQNDRPKTEALLKEIFTLEPNNTAALILRAKLHLNDGANKDAIADLRAVLKSDNNSEEALKLLAAAQEAEGEVQLALDSYYRVLEINPRDVKSLIGAANINLNMNETQRARSLLEQAVKTDSVNTTAIALLTRIYGNLGQWQNAEAVVAPLLEQQSTKTAALVLQGDIERGKNNWEQARQRYQQALALEPRVLEAVAGYTDTYLINKDYSGAEAFLKSHVQKYPELDYAKEMLAKVYLSANKQAEAIKIYQSLIEKSPDRITPIQKLSGIYVANKNYRDAEAVLRKGITTHPDAIDLYLILANLLETSERFSESKELYETVLAKSPKNTLARNNYAVLLVNYFANKENLQKAMELANGLAEIQRPTFQDTLGWVHYKNGNYQQAISYLQAAVKLQPKTDEFRYHLGMAYFKSGDLNNAKTELQLATRDEAVNYFGVEEAKEVLKSI